jgi:hypothetical protein
MAERPIGQMTLRELFIAAERHTRELVEHLDKNFVPKADAFARMLEPRAGAATDLGESRADQTTVRRQAGQLVESDRYTAQVHAKLEEYLRAIEKSAGRVVAGD